MLSPATPYPYVGSYALIELDGRLQLARIVMRRAGEYVVGLPLRDGASGNMRVAPDALIDATPLTDAELAELNQLTRSLAGYGPAVGDDGGRKRRLRTPRQKAMAARRDALRERLLVLAPLMVRLLAQAAQRERKAA